MSTAVLEEREAAFWHWAHQVAACTQDRGVSLCALTVQWLGIFPDATEEEQRVAVANLRSILRIGPVR